MRLIFPVMPDSCARSCHNPRGLLVTSTSAFSSLLYLMLVFRAAMTYLALLYLLLAIGAAMLHSHLLGRLQAIMAFHTHPHQ